MEGKISVIVVDDFELSRMGLRYMLTSIGYIEQVGEATNGKELFTQIDKIEPDIIFMDVNLELENGIDITRQILNKHPDIYVVALTSSKDIQDFIDMLDAGAAGFLLKNVTKEELEKALSIILSGEMYFSKEFMAVAKQIMPKHGKRSKTKLSDREKEVLTLICNGHSNQQIADELQLSSHTIDAHRKKILSKTGAKNTASMIMIAIRDGLIDMA